MHASSSLPAITYSSSVLFPSSGGTSSAHTSKREARAAAHTTRATPEVVRVKAWRQSNTHLSRRRRGAALAELHHVLPTSTASSPCRRGQEARRRSWRSRGASQRRRRGCARTAHPCCAHGGAHADLLAADARPRAARRARPPRRVRRAQVDATVAQVLPRRRVARGAGAAAAARGARPVVQPAAGAASGTRSSRSGRRRRRRSGARRRRRRSEASSISISRASATRKRRASQVAGRSCWE